MSLASYGPEEFGPFQSVARSDRESIAPGSYVFGARYTARRACPEGATGLSPGFQPWEPPSHERRALKGRQIERPNKVEIGFNGQL
jgi:hypothetical protein